jgi:hypothetical protein
LIEENEIGVENCDIKVRLLANIAQIFDHLFFVIGVADVDCLNEKTRCDDA